MAESPDQESPPKSGVPTRILTALGTIPFVFLLIWAGQEWFVLLIGICTLLGLLEFHRITRRLGAQHNLMATNSGPRTLFVGILVAELLILTAYNRAIIDSSVVLWISLPFMLAGTIGAFLVWKLLRHPIKSNRATLGLTLGAAIFLGGTLSHAVLLRQTADGGAWILFVLITVFATDTLAYIVGRTVGKHPMAPTISPKKTWEGSFGGLVGAILAATFATHFLSLPIHQWQGLILGLSISMAAQLGDLAQSKIKRVAGIKDTGRLLPGHGGILDRLDSLVLPSVIVYHVVRWTLQ